MFPDLRHRLKQLTILNATLKKGWKSAAANIARERQLQLFLAEYRRRLASSATTGRFRKIATRNLKRYAKKRSRILRKKINGYGGSLKYPKPLLLAHKYAESRILTNIVPSRESIWTPILQRSTSEKSEISIKNFSFIDDPDGVLQSIEHMVMAECKSVEAQLHFDDRYCLDVSPYLVLAEVWPFMANVFRGGRMSQPIQKVVDALGLRKDLQMRLFPDDRQDIWAFPRRVRRPSGSSRSPNRNLEPQTRERVADEFCDAVDRWLLEATENLELTPDGQARFARIIGELLDNAERHSDPQTKDGGWSIGAFMARRKEEDEEVFRCHMGFVSVGATIAESLKTAAPLIAQEVDKYSRLHERNGQSRDTLSTVVALQDGITRDAAAALHQRGGIGLQDVIEFINILGSTALAGREPKMTIVSGSSCIKVRAPYLFGKRNGKDQPRMIWFNPANRAEDPPDLEHVHDLRHTFAGTVVGLAFVLDAKDLMAKLQDGNKA